MRKQRNIRVRVESLEVRAAVRRCVAAGETR